MTVVDASVLTTALIDDGAAGDLFRTRLRGLRLAAPELLDVEVLAAIRGLVRTGLPVPRATAAVTDLASLPIRRLPHRPLLARIFELRDNLTAYDAAYVALAEVLDVVLLTADARLARAPGPRCAIELLRSF